MGLQVTGMAQAIFIAISKRLFGRHKLGVQKQYPFAKTGSAPTKFSSGFSGGVRWNVEARDLYRNGARQLLSKQKYSHIVIRGKKISYGFFPASGYDATARCR
jgi:hypothetical protein